MKSKKIKKQRIEEEKKVNDNNFKVVFYKPDRKYMNEEEEIMLKKILKESI